MLFKYVNVHSLWHLIPNQIKCLSVLICYLVRKYWETWHVATLKFCFEMLTPDPLYLRCSQTEGGTITIWRSWRGYLQNTNWSVYFTSNFHFVWFIPVGLVCQPHCGLYYFKLRVEATPCFNPQRMNGSCPLLHCGILTPSKM